MWWGVGAKNQRLKKIDDRSSLTNTCRALVCRFTGRLVVEYCAYGKELRREFGRYRLMFTRSNLRVTWCHSSRSRESFLVKQNEDAK